MENTRESRGRAGLTRIDVATLLGIGLVLVVVSLPRLRVLAREDNQNDAFEIALTLHRALDAHPELVPELANGASLELLVAESPVLGKRLEDVELLEEGRRLRCHGYLFDVTRSSIEAAHRADGSHGAGAESGAEPMVVRAWPWQPHRTGRAAYVVTPAGEVLEHANLDGRFGGPAGAPTPTPSAGSGSGSGSERENAGWHTVRLDTGRLRGGRSAL